MTLESVARLAGVSRSTVSRALRGNPRLPSATITAIRAIADQVGYRTNPLMGDIMRNVRRGGSEAHHSTLAYLTFHPTADGWRANSTYARFYEGARDRATKLGFSLDVIWVRQPGLNSTRLTALLQARGITGVIVGPRPGLVEPDFLNWSKFAAASVGVPLPDIRLSQAASHHARGMERLLTALRERGYRRPGLALLEAQMSRTDPGWVATWVHDQTRRDACERVSMLVQPVWRDDEIADWVRNHRPDVVIGVDSALIDALQRSGWRVPDDIGFAHLSRPDHAIAPAGIDQHPHAIGAAAVDLVADQFFSGDLGLIEIPRVLLLEPDWCDGWTVRRAI
jgi:LacI family transcriptional regulator